MQLNRKSAPSREDPFDVAVQAVYAAALDARRWPDAIAEVARLGGATAAHLFSPTPQMLLLLRVAHNLDPAAGVEYAEHWWQHDVWIERALRLGVRLSAGTSCIGDELISHAELMRTGFGHDFAHRHGADQLIGNVLFDASTPGVAPPTILSLLRDARRERFQRAEQRRLSALIPHLQRAVEIHWRLQRTGDSSPAAPAQQALDGLDDALFLLSAGGRVVQANRRAQALAAAGRNVVLRNDRIERLGRRCTPPAAEAVERALRTGATVQLVLELDDAALPLARASVHPLAPGVPLGLADAPALMLLVQLPQRPSAALLEQVGRLYGFTAAEQRVALLLLDGMTVNEVAAVLGVRPSTVKTQVSALLGKGGYARVIDLVRALTALG